MRIEELRNKAIKEYHFFDKKTNIKFDEEDEIDFLGDITEEDSVNELDEIRFDMARMYFEAISQIIEEKLDSFVLVDVKEYNDEFMEIGEEYEKLFVDRKKIIHEPQITKAKELFNKVFLFYKKIQKNERNLIRKGKKEFYGKILPTWFAIFSAAWIALMGIFIYHQNIELNLINISGFIGSWFLIFIAITIILRKFLYRKTN